MKRKYNHFILAILIGVILGIVVSGMVYLNNENSNKINSTVENEINKVIQMKNLTELIDEVYMQNYKGPGPNKGKFAYITIDDGPTKYTNQILDILDKNDVKATFFMIDGNMKKRPEEVKRIAREGHGAGFHSVSHDTQRLYKTPEAALEEFNKCSATYESITRRKSKLIRLPYGSRPYTPEESYNMLVENKYLVWDWNLDTEDWRATTDNIVSNLLYYGRDRKNLVILLHEKEQSVEALDSIIKVLKSREYEILPLNESIYPLNFWNKNL